MFSLNFKKEWRMHRPLMVLFFIITAALFAFITILYFIIKYSNIEGQSLSIVSGIWTALSGITSMLATILPIVLMYKVLKNDLGKNNVHYTVFTPQSISAWFFPKLLFIFIVQGLFALIQLGNAYFLLDATSPSEKFDTTENIIAFLSTTFEFSLFALITICMAIYYSFRKKGLTWSLIVATIILYFIGNMVYAIYTSIQSFNDPSSVLDTTKMMLTQYGINSVIGIIFITISLYLFDKKIEY
jgi:hypothetical protein